MVETRSLAPLALGLFCDGFDGGRYCAVVDDRVPSAAPRSRSGRCRRIFFATFETGRDHNLAMVPGSAGDTQNRL
jgi:hypothetical protein